MQPFTWHLCGATAAPYKDSTSRLFSGAYHHTLHLAKLTVLEAWTAAPDEMPTRRPSSRASRRAMSMASSLVTCTQYRIQGLRAFTL